MGRKKLSVEPPDPAGNVELAVAAATHSHPEVITTTVDVRMNCTSYESLAADMRKKARTNGIARMPCRLGELVVVAKPKEGSYNWTYRVVIVNGGEEVFVVREGIHPTMADIAISLILRMDDLETYLLKPPSERQKAVS